MKLFEYVNSKDIQMYWKEIGFRPSAIESAWLIRQGKNQTLKMKHKAWQELIEEKEDFIIETGFCEIPRVSLRDFLKRYMEIEQMLVAAFYKGKDNAVYSCRMYFGDNDEWYNEPGIFASFDEAYAYFLDGEPPYPTFVEFVKTYIGDEAKQIFIRFNLEKEIVRVDESGYITDEIDYYIFQGVFGNLDFSFPVPFTKGDIVHTVRGKYTRPSPHGGTFIIESVDNGVCGVMVGDGENVYCRRIFDYMDLEHASRSDDEDR